MSAKIILLSGRAPRALRDQFVTALDGDDHAALRVLAVDLRSCSDVLPRAACVSLGLPRGSTYASAAMSIIAS
ncbi:MAG: hypothetical protein ND866_07365 [Pyrinomonadaceae bacterium]|nr:hypothetical protein [Pyrinomonadaceae bacterium]